MFFAAALVAFTMSNQSTRKSRAAHGWGILLGLFGLVLVVMLSGLLPAIDVLWQLLLALFVLIFVRSLVGYLFPGLRGTKTRRHHTPAAMR